MPLIEMPFAVTPPDAADCFDADYATARFAATPRHTSRRHTLSIRR